MIRSSTRRALAACTTLFALVSLAACGSDSTSNNSTVTLKDVTLTLTAGLVCDGAAETTDFTGTAGKSVVISASGASNTTPIFILYAPDYATQLAGSTATGAGKSKLTFTLLESGVHHVDVCDLSGVGGHVRITVTQQTF